MCAFFRSLWVVLIILMTSCSALVGSQGPSIVTHPDQVNLGIIATDTPTGTQITVTNTGTREAVFSNVVWLSDTAWSFSSEPSMTIPAQSDPVPLELSLETTTNGFHSDMIRFEWYDAGRVHEHRIGFRALVDTPTVMTSRSRLDFGPVDSGAFHMMQLVVTATGVIDADIDSIELLDTSGVFSFTASPVLQNLPSTISPGQDEIISVRAELGISDNPTPTASTLVITFDGGQQRQVALVVNDCLQTTSDRWDQDGDGYSVCSGDCDDSVVNINPGAIDVFDGLDNDCDGVVQDNALSVDNDGDGFCEHPVVCADGTDPGDCHDLADTAYPGATEVVDGLDNNCDGLTDENSSVSDDDGDGVTELDGDCDDALDTIHPGALEARNGVDDNCDTRIDEDIAYFDEDGDGFPSEAGDCDDTNPQIHPHQPEICDDGVDNNCDNLIDLDDPHSCSAASSVAIAGGCVVARPMVTRSANMQTVYLFLLCLVVVKRRKD